MIKLQILGTGCAKCTKLTELTKEAADKSGIEYEIEKVSDIREIMKFGVMTTPALVVNGEVKVAGRVPGIDEIQKDDILTSLDQLYTHIYLRIVA